MNKAFVKEDDDREPRCPAPEGCGGLGTTVPTNTVEAQAPEDLRANLSRDVLYCPNPGCPVAYFDPWGATVPVSALASVIYPKDPAAPLCPCFGIRPEDIIEDAERKDPGRLRDLIKNAEGPDAQCATRAPDGQCCASEARRLFMRHMATESE